MQLELTIDGKKVFLTVDSDKPLSLILREDFDNTSILSRCNNASCGNCVVLLSNGYAALSCLIPAYKIQNESITTYDGYSRTRNCRDIEKAYSQTKCKPCPRCYASRTLLIESTIKAIELFEEDQIHKEKIALSSGKKYRKPGEEEINRVILNEIKPNTCDCLDENDILRMVKEAYKIRRARTK